jgi:hypothetical protein
MVVVKKRRSPHSIDMHEYQITGDASSSASRCEGTAR